MHPEIWCFFISSITIIYFYSGTVGNGRMSAPGGAFSAALRWSQDVDIVKQKHRHADRSARSLQAADSYCLCIQRSTSCSINYFPARCRAAVFSDSCFQWQFQRGSFFQMFNHYFNCKREFLFAAELSRKTTTSDVLARKGGAHGKVSECRWRKSHQRCQHCLTTHTKSIVLPSRRWLLV